MKKKLSQHWSSFVVRLLLVVLLVWPTGSGIQPVLAQANNTTYSGQATVVRATVLGLPPVVLSDTGPLPGSGGARQASLLEASVPGLLTAEVLHASTVGQGEHSRSEASVAKLNLTVGGNTIAADFLMARAEAACRLGGGCSVGGASEIVALDINGQRIIVAGQPNQTITLPNGRVVINEQSRSQSDGTCAITVNALHVVIDGIADVIISSAHADINCRQPVCPGGDFVTGGGWITGTPSGAKGTFGVAGGIKNGAFWGHLSYIDHGNGVKVKGTGVTAYIVVDDMTRHIEGTAEINGQGGFTYRVDVADRGEPGRNDSFMISLSNGYTAMGNLAGGNIQLHQPCRKR